MANKTHGSLAQDAAAHIAGSSDTVQSLGGGPQEIERQTVLLSEWAGTRNVILDDAYTADLEKQEGTTAEHEVFYRAADNRAVKRTYSGTFGVTTDSKGNRRHATPLFYLRRLELMNRIFGSDLSLEGIALSESLLIGTHGLKPSMVISQAWHEAADINNPHPSESEVKRFMESLGFSSMSGLHWISSNGKVFVSDTRVDNFIKSSLGVIPIDLVIGENLEPDPAAEEDRPNVF